MKILSISIITGLIILFILPIILFENKTYKARIIVEYSNNNRDTTNITYKGYLKSQRINETSYNLIDNTDSIIIYNVYHYRILDKKVSNDEQ
jgi:hypothetical protein